MEVKLEDMRVLLGNNITLRAQIDAEGHLGSWYFQGNEIQDGGRYSIQSDGKIQTLIVLGAEINDTGLYMLKVNGTESQANITVYGKTTYKCI